MGAFSLIVVINLLNRGSRMAASSLRISAEALAILLETRAFIAEVRDLRIAIAAELEEAMANLDAVMDELRSAANASSSQSNIAELLISAKKAAAVVAEIGDKLVALEPLSVSAILEAAQESFPRNEE